MFNFDLIYYWDYIYEYKDYVYALPLGLCMRIYVCALPLGLSMCITFKKYNMNDIGKCLMFMNLFYECIGICLTFVNPD